MGGSSGNGTIFKMTPAGALTTLLSFTGTTGPNPGSQSYAGLVQGRDGNFYGTTSAGGSGGGGTVFKMTPPYLTGSTGGGFTYQVSASNNPTSFSAIGLPPGFTINPATGLISGTPSVSGTSNVTINATNAGGTVSQTITIVVLPLPPGITSALSAMGTSGIFFSYLITATNNPTRYKAPGLPAGLSLNAATGLISGIPTVAGTTNVTVSASNAGGTTTATLTITVNPSAPVITSGLTATGAKGSAFSYQITAANAPTNFSTTGLPAGLSVDSSTGLISGTPTVSGTFSATISANNASGTGSAALVLTLLPPQSPVITSSALANGTFGSAFSYQITATFSPTSYNITNLPAGLTVNTSTGLISGTPTQTGVFTSSISASNASGTGSGSLTISVQTLVAWGSNSSGETSVPTGLSNVAAISAAQYDSLVMKSNGTVVAWGNNDFGQANVPSGLNNVVAVASGSTHSLALKSDGTVTTWGNTVWGLGTVPSGLSNVVAIAAGQLHSLALKSDGTVLGWGLNSSGQVTIPSGLNNIVAIAAGSNHSVALKADGTVVTWGYYPNGGPTPPTGLSNVVAIAAGESHDLALKSDGTVVAWGSNWAGQTSVPSGLNNVVAIAAGTVHSLALKADGSVVAWGAVNAGYQNYGQVPAPAGLKNVVAITAGYCHNLALTGNDSSIAPPAVISPLRKLGAFYPFQYRIIAKNNPTSYSATGLPAGLSVKTSTGLISGTPTQSGTFNSLVSASNAWGTGSATLVLNVLPPPPIITSALTSAGTNSSAMNYQIAATNSPASYNATGLPTGLSVNTATGLISGTVTTTGTTNVTVSASNVGGTGTAILVITIRTAYAAWQNQMFTPVELSNPTLSGDAAAPMGDGISNLMKYALGLDPRQNGTASLPVTQILFDANSGINYLTMTINRKAVAPGITYVVEVSGDLANWKSVQGTDVVNLTNTPILLKVRDNIPIGDPLAHSRYIRLRITNP